MKKKGARSKLREYLLSHLGDVLSSDDLREAAGGISEWARRVRELRSEEGFQILTHNDRSDLKPGQYLLLDPKPQPAFERGISKETRALVLDRNGFTCPMCGAVAGEPHPYDPGRKTRLQIGHVIDQSVGGSDDASNLRAICSVCNEGASNLTLDPPTALKLLAQVRRATGSDQLQVLKWLMDEPINPFASAIEDLSPRRDGVPIHGLEVLGRLANAGGRQIGMALRARRSSACTAFALRTRAYGPAMRGAALFTPRCALAETEKIYGLAH